MSKRKLLAAGRREARRPAGTIRACRRWPACAAAATRPRRSRDFCARIGVAKSENVIDVALLEDAVREDLNRDGAARDGGAAAAEGRDRELPGRPRRAASTRRQQPGRPRRPGRRQVPFSRELCIERDDFMEDAAEEVLPARARAGRCGCATRYFIKCERVVKDAAGERRSSCAARTTPRAACRQPGATAARSRARSTGCRRRTRVAAEVRLYDRLFT